MPKILKSSNLIVLCILMILSSALKAQDFYKGNPWLFNYNVNIVIEDAEQFRSYFNGKKIVWNISPFNFCAEKRLNKGKAFLINVGSSLYPLNQQIDGTTLKKPVDVFSIEGGLKFNFNYLVKEDNKFDPYIQIDAGFWTRGSKAYPSIGAGFGFNHWFSNTFGIRANIQYKDIVTAFEINLPDRRVSNSSNAKTSNEGLVVVGFGIVHIVN